MSYETSFGRDQESHETKQYPEVKISPFYQTTDGQTLNASEHTVYEIGDPKLFSLEELYAQIIEDFDDAETQNKAKELADSVRQKHVN